MSNDTKQPWADEFKSQPEDATNPGLSCLKLIFGVLAVALLLCFILALFTTGYLAAAATGVVIVIGLLGFADPRD